VSAVEVRDLFRVYSTPEGHAAALQGLTLSVQEKEVLVVLGPSGSGKSTLLRVLAGLEQPSAGTAHVFDADLGRLSSSRLAEYRSRTTGYVEQHYSLSLDPDLTARELVGVQLGLAGAPGAKRERRADELLERVGLAEKGAARPAELSGGEQQRIAVCAALAHGPKLLLADEPTGELDAASAGFVYELIGELAREHGCTTVLVSHDVESTAIADRTVRVRDGRVSEETERGDGETLVVARGGWVRLPEELLVRARIGSRARAELGDEGIVVSAAGERTQPGSRDGQTPAPAVEEKGTVVAQARGVGKRYGAGARETVVLDGLDADFRGGRLTALTGPSGSGKTIAGSASVLGSDLAELGREERAALRRDPIAFIPQDPALTPFLSARENVEVALALRDLSPDEAHQRALDALSEVGLAERAEQRVARLSAGERQRVAIARALATEAKLLLADEPTARLDEANALAVGALFGRYAREHGAAVVCATHDPLVVAEADDVLAL